ANIQQKASRTNLSPPPPLSPHPIRGEAAMQIQVRCGCGEAACPEWAVVEVQGVLQPQPCFSGRIQGLHIGRLCSTSSAPTSKARTTNPPSIFGFLIWFGGSSRRSCHCQGGYTFTVGYHELAGSKVTLKKPLLVLRKKKNDNGDTGELGQGGPAAAAEVELEVIGIIRHKILFKDRPKALISKPVPKEKKALPAAATPSTVPPAS
uniref:Chromosome transmission fidelity protein 8 n=3 Tax=Triticinae TaxID=1648030 RepID=A0A453KKJ7_AEGTS